MWVKGDEKDFTHLAYQDVAACGSQPDKGAGGYVHENDVNHGSDNGGGMMIS